jgi:cell division protein FtsA
MRAERELRAGLDVGTTKVSALIGERRGKTVRVIGVGTTPSEGLKQGVVVDIERAAESIRRAVDEAVRMAGVSAPRFNVGIAGEHIRGMNSRGVVAIPSIDQEITEEDVERALRAARNFSLPYDREVIHTIPQEFIVDDQRGIQQPEGMYGARLEARVHVVTGSRPALDNVVKALHTANVDYDFLVLEPLASSCAVLTEEEKELGVLLVDIGGGTTDVLVFRDGGVVASGVIGLGGNAVTSDLAYGLRTAPKNAEAIKVKHGCALSSLVPPEDKVEVPGIGFREKKEVSRQILAAIIEPRMTELFSLIEKQLTKGGAKKYLGAGVVLTGGASMLEGCRELAEQVFDLPVRVGTPIAVEGLVEVVDHPMYATGVGLLLYDGRSELKGGESDQFAKRWKRSWNQLKRAIASFI